MSSFQEIYAKREWRSAFHNFTFKNEQNNCNCIRNTWLNKKGVLK